MKSRDDFAHDWRTNYESHVSDIYNRYLCHRCWTTIESSPKKRDRHDRWAWLVSAWRCRREES